MAVYSVNKDQSQILYILLFLTSSRGFKVYELDPFMYL